MQNNPTREGFSSARRDAVALNHEMTDLNRQADDNTRAVAPDGTLEVLANGWDRPVVQHAGSGELKIGTQSYADGLYCIAPSRIAVRLPGCGSSFSAIAGVDINQSNQGWRRPLPDFKGKVVFSVRVGARLAFQSRELSANEKGEALNVSLDGAREFSLDIAAAGPVPHIAWSDWAEARVTLADGRVLPLGKMTFRAPEARWKHCDVLVEWGFLPGTADKNFDGAIAVTSARGKVGSAVPLTGDTATKMMTERSWRSGPASGARRGIVLPVLYTDATRGPDRTIVTVRTISGSFSFLPDDLRDGPILAPEFGFFVADAASNIAAGEYCPRHEALNRKTVRRMARVEPEQSWQDAMHALRGPDFRLPPLVVEQRDHWVPAYEPNMSVDVPDPHLAFLWRQGAWGITRHFTLIDREDVTQFGKGPNSLHTSIADVSNLRKLWDPADPRSFFLLTGVWQPLALEADRIIVALDHLGMHRAARDCIDLWLLNQQPDGALGLDTPPEQAHALGKMCILWAITEHYRLTGDREWLQVQAPRLKAAADWITARRRSSMKDNLTSEELEQIKRGVRPPSGLQPSIAAGDGGGRYFILADAYSYQSLRLLADVLRDVDPDSASELSNEADQYLKVLKPVLEEAITLSPVMRTRDGTYRSFLPQSFADRGPRSIELPPGSDVYSHWAAHHCDYAVTSVGIECFLRSRVLETGDTRLDGHFDVIEDRFLWEHPWYYIRKPDYNPERDWFHVGGWAYQSPSERLSDFYLRTDDVANFLRAWQNRCVVDMYFKGDPFGEDHHTHYMFKEHTWFNVYDKQQNRAVFMTDYRNMLVMEMGDSLWLAKATPRAWMEQGRKISVKNAPTHFGTVSFEIASDVDNRRITATVEMPARKTPASVILRLRHPKSERIKGVTVNGREWRDFDKDKETIKLKGLTGTVSVTADY